MLRDSEKEFQYKWRSDTETIIALAQTILALAVAALYLAADKPSDAGAGSGFTPWALGSYPLICLARVSTELQTRRECKINTGARCNRRILMLG